MDATTRVLNRIDERLAAIERIEARLNAIESILADKSSQNVLRKSAYSYTEVAKLSAEYGIRAYRPFTIRLACSQGGIPEAEKLENGAWRIPRDAVLCLLNTGIPPERRIDAANNL